MVNHVERQQLAIHCIKTKQQQHGNSPMRDETCTWTSATASSSMLTCQHGSCVSVRAHNHSLIPTKRKTATRLSIGHTHAQQFMNICFV